MALFKSLINARRIASISRDVEKEFESLSFANVTSDVIMSLVDRVRREHGGKVAGSLVEEIPLEVRSEVDLFRLRHIINIAKGFLYVREQMREKVRRLAEERWRLSNEPVEVRALPREASSTPWSEAVVLDDFLVSGEDWDRLRRVRRRIEEINAEIGRIKREYLL